MSSPLAAAELADRLAARLQPIPRSPFWFPKGGVAFLGRVNGATFRMYPRGLGRNSWRWVYSGTVVTDGSGSRLTGLLGPPRALLVFSALWVAMVLAFIATGLVGVIHGLASGGGVGGPLIFTVVTPLMLAFFVVMSNTGWRSASREWALMEKWLQTTVRATPAEPPAEP